MKRLWHSQLPGLRASNGQVRVSPDGQRVSVDVSVVDLATRAVVLDPPGERAAFSPDGRAYAVVVREPHSQVALYRLDEAVVPVLTDVVPDHPLTLTPSSPDAPELILDGPPSGIATDESVQFHARGTARGDATLKSFAYLAGPVGGELKNRVSGPVRGAFERTLGFGYSVYCPSVGLHQLELHLTDSEDRTTIARWFVDLRPWTSWIQHEDDDFDTALRHRLWQHPIRTKVAVSCGVVHLGHAVVVTDLEQLLVLDPDTGELLYELSGHPGAVEFLGHDPQSGCVVSVCSSWIVVWDDRDWWERARMATPVRSEPYAVEPAETGAELVCKYSKLAFSLPDLVPSRRGDRRLLVNTPHRRAELVRDEGVAILQVRDGESERSLPLPLDFDDRCWRDCELVGETLLLPTYGRVACMALADARTTHAIGAPRSVAWAGQEILLTWRKRLEIRRLDDPEHLECWTIDGSIGSAAFTSDGRWVVVSDGSKVLRIERSSGEIVERELDDVTFAGGDPTQPLVWLTRGDDLVQWNPHDTDMVVVGEAPRVRRHGMVWRAGEGVQVSTAVFDGAGKPMQSAKRRVPVDFAGHAGAMAWDALDPAHRFATEEPDGTVVLWDAASQSSGH